MRYRMLDNAGDMVYGHGSADYFVDSPQAVIQAVVTGLKLFQGEWFLDTSAGMPWFQKVVGYNTQALYDAAIQQQILSTQGVTGIASYSSVLSTKTRLLMISCSITCLYGVIPIPIPFIPPSAAGFGISPFGIAAFGV